MTNRMKVERLAAYAIQRLMLLIYWTICVNDWSICLRLTGDKVGRYKPTEIVVTNGPVTTSNVKVMPPVLSVQK